MVRKHEIPRSGEVDSGDPAAQGAATRRRIDIGTWGPWLTMACILAGGLFVAWAKMDTTQLTYEVHQLRSEQAQLTREQRLLSSELSHLQSPAYLSAHASDLGLQEPPPGVVIRVE